MKKAPNVLEGMNFSPEEGEIYEEHLKWLRMEANTLKKMKQLVKQEARQKVKQKPS